MKKQLQVLIRQEINQFKIAYANGDHDRSFLHLGRAHIISQNSTLWHLYIHWLMFWYAFSRRDSFEIRGQILRLLVTVPGHMLGKVPKGNIGWSTVSLTEEMKLPPDIENLFH